MLMSYTLRGLGFYSDVDLKEDYEIRDYKIHINSKTKMIDVFRVSLLNEITGVISSEKISEDIEGVNEFKEYCKNKLDEIWVDGKFFDGKYQEKHDGYAYCFDRLYLDENDVNC